MKVSTSWSMPGVTVRSEGRHGPLAIAGMVVGGVALFILVAFLLGWVVMSLWNAIMPGIFKLPTIGYWQAIGLFILAHLLIGGHGMNHHHGRKHRHHHRGYGRDYRLEDMPPEQRERIRLRFEEELETLPQEERDRIRRRWSSCCG
jgi:hypothetical protein